MSCVKSENYWSEYRLTFHCCFFSKLARRTDRIWSRQLALSKKLVKVIPLMLATARAVGEPSQLLYSESKQKKNNHVLSWRLNIIQRPMAEWSRISQSLCTKWRTTVKISNWIPGSQTHGLCCSQTGCGCKPLGEGDSTCFCKMDGLTSCKMGGRYTLSSTAPRDLTCTWTQWI